MEGILTFREAAYGSAEWEQAVNLRDRVLRQPLGLHFSREDLAAEQAEHHLTGWKHDRLVVVLLLRRLDDQIVKMRQVAVEPDCQNLGYGKAIVGFSEDFAKREGFSTMELHARLTAVPFYLALGYRQEGEQFEEVGIPHYKMLKKINDRQTGD